jgi:peptidoglycan-associated lipoprotein
MPGPRWLAAVSLTLGAAALAACHTKAPAIAPSSSPTVSPPAVPPRPPAPAPPPPRTAAAPARAPSEDDLFAAKSLDELNREHPLGDAYFDYDRSTLGDEARDALQRDARWLSRWRSARITIQGQCDERGSAEYNLSLGERRALAVRDYLASLGVPDARMTIVSLGKESPVCGDDNESCWSKNRRGHFVISGK